MANALCVSVFSLVTGHLPFFGFVLGATALLGLLAFDLRRAGRASGSKKDEPMKFLAPFRDENGMPIFYEAGEDPTERYAQRVLARTRRANAGRGVR